MDLNRKPRLCKRNHYVAGWNAVDMGNFNACLLCKRLNKRQADARRKGWPIPTECEPVSLKKTRRQIQASRKARGIIPVRASLDLYEDWLYLKEQGYTVFLAQERLGASKATIYKAIQKYG